MTPQQATVTVRKIESPVEQARVDQLYNGYRRAELQTAHCIRCREEAICVRDTEKHWQFLTNTVAGFSQIQDFENGEPRVMKLNWLIDHQFVCRGTRA